MYQSSRPIVALTPSQPLPANQFFHLWINGGTSGGVEDMGGNMLAGDGSTAGTSYTAMLAQGTSLKYYTPAGDQVNLKITGGGIIDDLLSGSGQGNGSRWSARSRATRSSRAASGNSEEEPAGPISVDTIWDWATSAMSG